MSDTIVLTDKSLLTIKDNVKAAVESHIKAGEQCKAAIKPMIDKGVAFKRVMFHVLQAFASEWPALDEDSRIYKKGDPIPLATIKKEPEHKPFRNKQVYKTVNAFERVFRIYFASDDSGLIISRDKIKKPEIILNDVNVKGMKKNQLIVEAGLQGLTPVDTEGNTLDTKDMSVEDLRKGVLAQIKIKKDPLKGMLRRLKVELKTAKGDDSLAGVVSALTIAIKAIETQIEVRALSAKAA
jgi:hypothetical protein